MSMRWTILAAIGFCAIIFVVLVVIFSLSAAITIIGSVLLALAILGWSMFLLFHKRGVLKVVSRVISVVIDWVNQAWHFISLERPRTIISYSGLFGGVFAMALIKFSS